MLGLGALGLFGLSSLVSGALGAAPEPVDGQSLSSPPPDDQTRPLVTLGPPSSFSVGLEAYGGILSQWTSAENRAHALGGGHLYVRYFYVQAGPFIEITDSGEASDLGESQREHFRTLGGFVGAWLPIEGSIDVNATLGYGARRYVNSSRIYGANGLAEDMGTVLFRIGISDRTSRRRFGARLGAGLFGSMDLGRRDVPWRRTFLREDGTVGETTGTTAVGGLAMGLWVSAALEMGGR